MTVQGLTAHRGQGQDLTPGLWAAFLQFLAGVPGSTLRGGRDGAGDSGQTSTTPWDHHGHVWAFGWSGILKALLFSLTQNRYLHCVQVCV